MVVKDEKNFIFGGFCLEAWHPSKGFFGSGHNFIYSFKEGEKPDIFRWEGGSNQHMFANEYAIGLGGHKGNFALYLKDDLLKGTSSPVESYNNKVLSGKSSFKV